MSDNCGATNIPSPVCTCPSGDGSLRWPCPAHPPAGRVTHFEFRMVYRHSNVPNGRVTHEQLGTNKAAARDIFEEFKVSAFPNLEFLRLEARMVSTGGWEAL